MTYTILSAQYANAEHTAAVIQTQEAGAVLVSEVDTPDLWAELPADCAAFVPPPESRTMDKRDFLALFTSDEKSALLQAAQASLDVAAWKWEFDAASFIDKDDPVLVQGIDALVQAGVLTASRRDEVLA